MIMNTVHHAAVGMHSLVRPPRVGLKRLIAWNSDGGVEILLKLMLDQAAF